jgi:hypothetical protein
MGGLGGENDSVRGERPASTGKKDGVAHSSVEVCTAMRARSSEAPAAVNDHPDPDTAGTGQASGLELTVGGRHMAHARAHHTRLHVLGTQGPSRLDGGLERPDEVRGVESQGLTSIVSSQSPAAECRWGMRTESSSTPSTYGSTLSFGF